jgi:HEXXH motif-containing protein
MWITEVTHIAIPLRGEGTSFRSGSHPAIPGLVELDMLAEDQILEALVHESAHLYLYLTEAGGPLINPDHTERYSSPLRADPRPLRGILLAYHALAFISARYRDALDVPQTSLWGERELDACRRSAREAEETLYSQLRHLTPAGQNFLDSTRQVLEYSSR